LHRTRRLWAGVAVLAVIALALNASVAGAANGGNSTKTQACKGTGYLDWLRADGSAFESPRACHSYAIHGGVMRHRVTPGPLPSFQQMCSSQLGGTFSTEVDNGEVIWLCTWGTLTKNGGVLPDWQFDANVEALGGACPGSGTNEFDSTGPGDLGYAEVGCHSGIPG